MKQTAVEQLISKIPLGIRMQLAELGVDFEQAKEMEKEKMIEFADNYELRCRHVYLGRLKTPQEYYEQTYGGNK